MRHSYDHSADRRHLADRVERSLARRRALLSVYCVPRLSPTQKAMLMTAVSVVLPSVLVWMLTNAKCGGKSGGLLRKLGLKRNLK